MSRPSAMRRGFTLIEILVVLAIVSILIALGIPAFNALTGAGSIEAARNVTAAVIGRARTLAINEGRPAGVLFYVDPATERTAATIVIVQDPLSSLDDGDPYDKYKSFVAGEAYRAPSDAEPAANTQHRGDKVVQLTTDMDATYRATAYAESPLSSTYLRYFGNDRPTVRVFRAKRTQPSALDQPGQRPPRNGPYYTPAPQYGPFPKGGSTTAESTDNEFGNTNWGLDNDRWIATAADNEQQLLPKGVGLQLIVAPIATGSFDVRGAEMHERYLRCGCILFDGQGRLMSGDVALSANGRLGSYLGLSRDAAHIHTAIGTVLYDHEAFKSHQFSEADFAYQPQTIKDNTAVIQSRWTNLFGDYPNAGAASDRAPFAAGLPSEADEEQWLDDNATRLLVGRASGALGAAE